MATAGDDKVNVNAVVRGFQKLQGLFGGKDKQFINYPGAGHDLPEEWQRPEIAKDLAKLIRRVKGFNGRVAKGGFVITPRVEEILETVSTTIPGVSSGVYPFRDQLEKGLIRNFPYRTTTQIPENLGEDANETEVYFADFNEYYFVENGGLQVESFRGATFQGADGNPVYGVQQGVTVVRGTGRHDYLLRHKSKAAVLGGRTQDRLRGG